MKMPNEIDQRSQGVKGLMVWISADLHRKFAIKCMQKNKTRKSVITEFIRLYIEDDNDGENEGDRKTDQGKE